MKNQACNGQKSIEVCKSAVSSFLQDANTPFTTYLFYIFTDACEGKKYALEELRNLEIDPNRYNLDDRVRFCHDYQAYHLVRSFPFYKGIDPLDLENDAIASILGTEEECRVVNSKILEDKFEDPVLLLQARRIVQRLVSDFRIEHVKIRPGPGATIGASGHKSIMTEKLRCSDISMDLVNHFQMIAANTQLRDIVPSSTESACRFTTVPYSASKLRGITIEPSLNVLVQLGLSDYLRKVTLPKVGIRFDKSPLTTDFHGELAMEGSLVGTFCTIDLSSASNRLSYVLVRTLFEGSELWSYLSAARTPKIRIANKLHTMQMYGGMGNGTTMPIQTLTYYALLKAAGCSFVSVYGDDIIVKSPDFEKSCRVLSMCGLKINPTKSYNTSYFRESCGYDYFAGKRIPKLKLKYELAKLPHDIAMIHLHNSLMRLGEYDKFHFTWKTCVSLRRRFKRFVRGTLPLVPSDFGDCGFHPHSLEEIQYKWIDWIPHVYVHDYVPLQDDVHRQYTRYRGKLVRVNKPGLAYILLRYPSLLSHRGSDRVIVRGFRPLFQV